MDLFRQFSRKHGKLFRRRTSASGSVSSGIALLSHSLTHKLVRCDLAYKRHEPLAVYAVVMRHRASSDSAHARHEPFDVRDTCCYSEATLIHGWHEP